jgi:hypothetical protein
LPPPIQQQEQLKNNPSSVIKIVRLPCKSQLVIPTDLTPSSPNFGFPVERRVHYNLVALQLSDRAPKRTVPWNDAMISRRGPSLLPDGQSFAPVSILLHRTYLMVTDEVSIQLKLQPQATNSPISNRTTSLRWLPTNCVCFPRSCPWIAYRTFSISLKFTLTNPARSSSFVPISGFRSYRTSRLLVMWDHPWWTLGCDHCFPTRSSLHVRRVRKRSLSPASSKNFQPWHRQPPALFIRHSHYAILTPICLACVCSQFLSLYYCVVIHTGSRSAVFSFTCARYVVPSQASVRCRFA